MKSQALGKSCCVVLASLVLLTGCGSKYGAKITDVVYYPQCYSPIDELRKDESSYRSTVATGAVVGALLGAIGGYMVTGDSKGALVGAAAGTAGGAATGYIAAEAQEERNTNKRMSMYMKELDGDISNLNTIKASAKMALQCYDREFKQAVSSYKGKRISRMDLDNRYKEIKNGSTEASRILGEVIDSTLEKERQYQVAINNEADSRTQPVAKASASSPRPSSKPTAAATPRPSAQPKPTPATDAQLSQMTNKKDSLSRERESLQAVSTDVSRMQSSWAAELAAIES